MMDWQNLLVSAVVQAVIGASIGFVCWLVLQRSVEKYDRLSDRVKDLEDRRILKIEEYQSQETEKNAARRKEIYERLAKMEREAMMRVDCSEKHEEFNQAIQEFRAAVIDQAKIGEKLSLTAAFVDEVNQRTIALKQDVDRMHGAQQHGRG